MVAQRNYPATLLPPIGGYAPAVSLMGMPRTNAVFLDNWFAEPDGLTLRDGHVNWITAIPKQCDRLHNYTPSTGVEKLFGTTADGVYDFTTAGVCGAVVIALTNGKTFSVQLSTGAGNYLQMVNGTDTLKQFDGTTWSSVATLGGVGTAIFSYNEVYRQRIFLVEKFSTNIDYLPPNSISGTLTQYPLSALFKKGGYIVALATWTLDGGVGPEDNFCIMTSKGEIAVYIGNDPATWSLRGVYQSALPMGDQPMYKYGGDILILTETGIIPMSSMIQSASIDRVTTVSTLIRPYLVSAAQQFAAGQGWQIISNPVKPFLMVNIPNSNLAVRQQAVMQAQTGAWSTFSSYNAIHWARKGTDLYYSASDGSANLWTVQHVIGNVDNGANIVATMLQAYSQMGYALNKKIELVKAYFKATGQFTYNMGIASDFQATVEQTQLSISQGLSTALWGTALWGQAQWVGGPTIIDDWQEVPDEYTNWKALYLQIISKVGIVRYLGADMLYKRSKTSF